MTDLLTVDLSALGPQAEPALVGSKAAGIGQLTALGFPVIPGVVVTTVGCDALVADRGGEADAVRAELAKFASTAGPETTFSVRPSSQHLVAGVATRLDVPARSLVDEVAACVADWDSVSMRLQRRHDQVPVDARIAVTVQPMRFSTVPGGGAGIAYSRHPVTGTGRSLVFLPDANGADPLRSDRATLDWDGFGQVHAKHVHRLDTALEELETTTRDAVEVEFIVVDDQLLFLHHRSAVRSGDAAVRVAAALAAKHAMTPEEAIGLVQGHHIEQLLHAQLSAGVADPLATGLGASPGAAVGAVYFTADDAADAYDRGEDVILVAQETSPEDVHGMELAEGILTSRGGLASHAAVVARGWGKPAVCGASEIKIDDRSFRVGAVVLNEGDVITIDGSTGHVYVGELGLVESDPPRELGTVMRWADQSRGGRVVVKANADTADDARVARDHGAEGIGLCRTEHQFLGERLAFIQRVILADSAAEEVAAIADLEQLQRSDFVNLLEAMDGLPVTIRLLDPPLHEFLPDLIDLRLRDERGDLSDAERALLGAAVDWAETNPMLGTRGVRLGVLRPELYRMQMRAVLGATADRVRAGGDPRPEIMIPLVLSASEMVLARQWLDAEVASLGPGDRAEIGDRPIPLGTMIETPRAALCVDDIAPVVDFLSFGTNDLTQLTLGISRDDVEARVMGAYLDQGLLPANPFETLDVGGVGQLVARSTAAARSVRPDLPIGVCGEHGGDPASIAFLVGAGLDSVSCSPFRVPVARLAAARAVARLSDA